MQHVGPRRRRCLGGLELIAAFLLVLGRLSGSQTFAVPGVRPAHAGIARHRVSLRAGPSTTATIDAEVIPRMDVEHQEHSDPGIKNVDGIIKFASSTSGVKTRSTEDRKLRSAIEGILRDSEDIRMSLPVASRQLTVAVGSAIGLALIGTLMLGAGEWFAVVLPACTSGIFVQISQAESVAQRARGVARTNTAEAVLIAARGERVLAAADFYKAFLPFGVGLTAIFAAFCVALKIFNEQLEEGAALPKSLESLTETLISADQALLVVLATGSLIGAVFTSDSALRMRTILTRGSVPRDAVETEWEEKQLPTEVREPELVEQVLFAFATLLLSCLPLAIAPNSIEARSVVTSATAGALAAVTLLYGEKVFADAERRVAIQSEQGSLANLFCAQACAEAAVLPAASTLGAAGLCAATAAVEFSKWLALVFPWPAAVLLSPRAGLGGELANLEASATWLERQIASKGRTDGTRPDALEESVQEFQRLRLELLSDDFTNEVKAKLQDLPVGATMDFMSESRETRRRVHLVAAEYGMASLSAGSEGKRKVSVTNLGFKIDADDEKVDTTTSDDLSLEVELRRAFSWSLPGSSKPVANGLIASAAVSTFAPLLTGKAVASLLLPIITGSVGILTTYQERVGKEAVSLAKQRSASIEINRQEAGSLIARARMMYGALPSIFAVTTCCMAFSVVGFMESAHPRFCHAVAPPLLLLSTIAVSVGVRRLRRIKANIRTAVGLVDGTPPRCLMASKYVWWMIPAVVAWLAPYDLPRKVTVACTLLMMEAGCLMSSATRQIVAAEYYASRAEAVVASAEAWTQQAARYSRKLPFLSAGAILATLLSTAFDTISIAPLSIWPLLGVFCGVRALQLAGTAKSLASTVKPEGESLQLLPVDSPFASNEGEATEEIVRSEQKELDYAESLGFTDEQARDFRYVFEILDEDDSGVLELDEVAKGVKMLRKQVLKEDFDDAFAQLDQDGNGQLDFMEFLAFMRLIADRANARSGLKVKYSPPQIGLPGPERIVKAIKRTHKLWDEVGVEAEFSPSAVEKTVQNVQVNFSELRTVSLRTYESGSRRTLYAVGSCVLAAVVAPFALSEVLTEVVVPVAGAVTTLFAAAAESNARRSVSVAKVRTCELGAVVGTMEQLLAVSGIFRARLMAAAGVAAGLASLALVARGVPPQGLMQRSIWTAFLGALAIGQAAMAAWCVRPLTGVLRFCKKADNITTTFNQSKIVTDENAWDAGLNEALAKKKTVSIRRLARTYVLPVLVAVPSLFLMTWPEHEPFHMRVASSTAVGSFCVGLMMYLAEKVVARTERRVAARQATWALTGAFSHQAEQSSALLPFATAATIAFSALITFVTEINPYTTSVLTLLQAVTWVIASRKGVAAKFESSAALQTLAVTEAPSKQKVRSMRSYEEVKRKMKRVLLKPWLI